jgi:hypothetical protein
LSVVKKIITMAELDPATHPTTQHRHRYRRADARRWVAWGSQQQRRERSAMVIGLGG